MATPLGPKDYRQEDNERTPSKPTQSSNSFVVCHPSPAFSPTPSPIIPSSLNLSPSTTLSLIDSRRPSYTSEKRKSSDPGSARKYSYTPSSRSPTSGSRKESSVCMSYAIRENSQTSLPSGRSSDVDVSTGKDRNTPSPRASKEDILLNKQLVIKRVQEHMDRLSKHFRLRLEGIKKEQEYLCSVEDELIALYTRLENLSNHYSFEKFFEVREYLERMEKRSKSHVNSLIINRLFAKIDKTFSIHLMAMFIFN